MTLNEAQAHAAMQVQLTNSLVQVRIVHANYWDVKSSKLVQLLVMAKAAVTGKPPTDLGDHGEVRMR